MLRCCSSLVWLPWSTDGARQALLSSNLFPITKRRSAITAGFQLAAAAHFNSQRSAGLRKAFITRFSQRSRFSTTANSRILMRILSQHAWWEPKSTGMRLRSEYGHGPNMRRILVQQTMGLTPWADQITGLDGPGLLRMTGIMISAATVTGVQPTGQTSGSTLQPAASAILTFSRRFAPNSSHSIWETGIVYRHSSPHGRAGETLLRGSREGTSCRPASRSLSTTLRRTNRGEPKTPACLFFSQSGITESPSQRGLSVLVQRRRPRARFDPGNADRNKSSTAFKMAISRAISKSGEEQDYRSVWDKYFTVPGVIYVNPGLLIPHGCCKCVARQGSDRKPQRYSMSLPIYSSVSDQRCWIHHASHHHQPCSP